MFFEVFHAWREKDTELLPLLKSLYSYGEPGAGEGRATGWLWSAGQQGQLGPQDWPAVLKETGPALVSAVQRRAFHEAAYTAAAYQAYLDGTGCDWHYDREWDCQAILSLGAARQFGIRGRKPGEKEFFVTLRHGSLLFMYPGFQDRFEHCVPVESVTGERVSIVFRGCYRP